MWDYPIDLSHAGEEELGARSHGGRGALIWENRVSARKEKGEEELGGR